MPQTLTAPTRAQRARVDARLFERYRREGDTAARDELVERFMPLARHIANKYADGADRDDLTQVAAIALLKAIDRYDPERGVAFSSYAVPTVVGEIKRYFRDYGWAVRPPRELQERALRVRRIADRLATDRGRSATPAEIAEAMDIGVEDVLEALQTVSAHRPETLDRPEGEGDERPLGAKLAVDDDGYEQAEAIATLSPLLSKLTDRERTILKLRFADDLTQSEIGELVGVSQMQVSRILRDAIAALQQAAA
jgi:RNA polymerase sigma-B factor